MPGGEKGKWLYLYIADFLIEKKKTNSIFRDVVL